MNALYAFMRVTDDLSDEPGPFPVKRAGLANWRAGLRDALEGRFTHPVHPALADTIRRFEIPPQYLFDVIDGVEMDLDPIRFETFADLYPYCYRVASAVGLACIHVWGLRPGARFAQADGPAESAGIAFQLTNILRDLGEDLARGRTYLPAEDLNRFNCPPEYWRKAACATAFAEMMQFQVERAREYFRQSEPLIHLLSSNGCGIFRMMRGTYRQLLERVADAGTAVLEKRVRVSRWRKGLLFAGGWIMNRGWC